MLGLAVTANPPARWHVYLRAFFFFFFGLTWLSVHFTLMDRELSELIVSEVAAL